MLTTAADGPLSFNQEWLLMTEEARRNAGLPEIRTEIPLVFRLRGEWRRAVLEQALRTLVQRHAVLGTLYAPSDKYPSSLREMQLSLFHRAAVFVPGLYVERPFAFDDMVFCERDAGGTDVDGLVLAEMVRRPVRQHPPLRAIVFHQDEHTRLLVLVVSHLVCDAWSAGIVVREFLAIYRATLDGASLTLPPVATDYRTFAALQHRRYRARQFAREETFWRDQWQQLEDAAIQHREIPFANAPPANPQAPLMARAYQQVSALDSTAVSAAARRLCVTPYVLFRGAMTLVLSAFTGKARIGFWANFANRRDEGLEHLVGWCANTHVVTVDLPLFGTTADLCREVSMAVRAAQRHEALPIAALWQRLGGSLDRHDTRVNMDLWFVRPVPTTSGPIEPLTTSWLPSMDLDVRLMHDVTSFGLRATFNRRRYAEDGVNALLSATVTIARRIALDPSTSVQSCLHHGDLCKWARSGE